MPDLSSQPSFRQLESSKGAEFDAFISIYAKSLSLREQKPRSEIELLPSRSDYSIVLLEVGGRIIGFTILFVPSKEDFCLLEYMAIHEEYRSFGFGAALFKYAFQDTHTRWGARFGLLEVDSERELCQDLETRQRRQNFYRRLGCRRIKGLAYQLPLAGQGPPPKMDLLVYSSLAMPDISESQLRQWLKTIYEQVYHCSPDDPRIDMMMAGISGTVQLG